MAFNLPGLPSLRELFSSANRRTNFFTGFEEGERSLGLARISE